MTKRQSDFPTPHPDAARHPARVCCPGQHTGPMEINAVMAAHGGAVVLDGYFPSDAFLIHAAVCPPASGFLPGLARGCHAFSQANPEFIHMTGLARSGGLWLCHSWIACAGQTLETTPVARDAYIGFDIALADRSASARACKGPQSE